MSNTVIKLKDAPVGSRIKFVEIVDGSGWKIDEPLLKEQTFQIAKSSYLILENDFKSSTGEKFLKGEKIYVALQSLVEILEEKSKGIPESSEANPEGLHEHLGIQHHLEEKVNPDKPLRYNKGKLRWGLLPMKALEPAVSVLQYGSEKYTVRDVNGDNNWLRGNGLNTREVLESMQRHLNELVEFENGREGEIYDKESLHHHIGHILCNALFYSQLRIIQGDHDILNPNRTPVSGDNNE